MKLIHPDSNSVEDDVFINSETLLMTDFVNLKIKLAQFFRGVHMGRLCVHVFIEVSAHICISICVYIVFLKKRYICDFIISTPQLDAV
jgi:hypothetical protein